MTSKEKQRKLEEINRPRNEELFNNIENQYRELAMVKAESKQIEEMANALYKIVTARKGKASMLDLATDLYNAGYRKQIEGENIAMYPSSAFECSECHWEDWDLFTADSAYNFCPNCGAKMKGGESDA